MVRETPLDAPAPDAIATVVEFRLGRSVADVTPFEEGLNAVYRVDRAGGDPVVVKTATFATDEELLTEAEVLDRVATESDVPVSAVFAALEPDDWPGETAAFVMSHCDGREVTDVLALSRGAHERLVTESGRHLAAVHEVRLVEGFGPLGRSDDGLTLRHEYESWPAWFDELASDAVRGLRGEGFTTDDECRFSDLAPAIGHALCGAVFGPTGAVSPALAVGDYRPANLVLAADDGADPVVRAVVDLGCGPTADGLLDLALAEDALIDVPLGGTGRAERLRDRFRSAYIAEFGVDRDELRSDRYTRYRVYARTRHMAAFGYWAQFARESDPDAVASRWRSFVTDRTGELG